VTQFIVFKVFGVATITWCHNGQTSPARSAGSNVSDAWRKWKRFELFSLASGLSSKEVGIQAVTLLYVVGPDALEIYNTFLWEDAADKIKVVKILEKFNAYCVPWRNIMWE